jgi:hypothetical protein
MGAFVRRRPQDDNVGRKQIVDSIALKDRQTRPSLELRRAWATPGFIATEKYSVEFDRQWCNRSDGIVMSGTARQEDTVGE